MKSVSRNPKTLSTKMWRPLINNLSLLTGINLQILDQHCHTIISQTNSINPVCRDFLKQNRIFKNNCHQCLEKWTNYVKNKNTYKLFICPLGLINFVFPICLNKKRNGYVLGGQIIGVPDNEHYREETLDLTFINNVIEHGQVINLPNSWFKNKALEIGIDQNTLLNTLKQFPQMKLRKIEELAGILKKIIEAVNAITSNNLDQRFEISTLKEKLRGTEFYLEPTSIARRILESLRSSVPFKKASLQLIRGDARVPVACLGFDFDHNHSNYNLLKPVSHDALIACIVNTREPLILSRTDDDPNWQPVEETRDVQSWIGVPFISHNTVIGILTIDYDKPDFYRESLRGKLKEFSTLFSPTLSHVAELYDAQRLVRDLEIINHIGQIMGAKMEIQDLMDSIVTSIAEKLNCSHCTIFLMENKGDERKLVAKAAHGGEQETLNRSFWAHEGLAGLVFSQGETLLLEDAAKHKQFAPSRKPRDDPRSMLVAPIKVGNDTIGVISADQDAFGWFTENDKRLLDILGRHSGIAIQRSLGFELLQEISNKILSSHDIGDILETLVNGSIKLLNASSGVIYLFDEEGKKIAKKFHPPDFNHPDPRMTREDGLTQTVIRQKKPLLIPKISKDKRVNEKLIGLYQSMIVIPVVSRDKVIAVIYVDDEDQHDFSEIEVSLLLTLANQAAIAIENAWNLKYLENAINSHSLLEEIMENLVLHEPDQKATLDRIGEGIRQLFGSEVSPTINLYDQSRNEFDECHSYGPLAKILRDPPRSQEGTGRHVLTTKSPLYLDDVTNPPSGLPTIRQKSIDAGIKSFAALPLKRKDDIVGVLYINSQKKIIFTKQFKKILETFASQAGVAIEIARLHQSTVFNNALMKAADLGFLASGICHEFYNNLQNMKSFLYEMEHLKDRNDIEKIITEFSLEINQAVTTIDNFRFLRSQAEKINKIDIDKLVENLIKIIRRKLNDEDIQIEYDNKGVNELFINPSLIQSVILNLLRNATEAVESESQGEKRILISLQMIEKDEVLLEVKDSGSGIPYEHRSNIFTPFYTTKKQKNMGVGLYLIQRIVTILNGQISYSSNNNWGGTTFKVFIPKAGI